MEKQKQKIIENGITLIGGTTGYDCDGQLYTREVLMDEKTKERYYSKNWIKNINITKTKKNLNKLSKNYYNVVQLNKKLGEKNE